MQQAPVKINKQIHCNKPDSQMTYAAKMTMHGTSQDAAAGSGSVRDLMTKQREYC
jgi:hypothetical protein